MGTTPSTEETKKRSALEVTNLTTEDISQEEEEEGGGGEEEEENQKISGKLLLKNCQIWKWEDEGQEGRGGGRGRGESSSSLKITGKVVSIPYLAIDYFGRIISLEDGNPGSPRGPRKVKDSKGLSSNSSNRINIDEELFERVIDVSNHLLLPGLIDSHIHVMITGESSYYLDLRDCSSIEQLKQTLQQHTENNPQLPWIIGINWDQVIIILILLFFF